MCMGIIEELIERALETILNARRGGSLIRTRP